MLSLNKFRTTKLDVKNLSVVKGGKRVKSYYDFDGDGTDDKIVVVFRADGSVKKWKIKYK